MLSQYNPIDLEMILETTPYMPPFPKASDRQQWETIKTRQGHDEVTLIIRQAEEAASNPIPALPASLYLDCKRTGRREGYQNPLGQRQRMLRDLALAECLEYKGRFLDPLMDLIWAICEESSWVLPAHQFELVNLDHLHIDLNAAYTALVLSEVDSLLGPDLDPAVGARIRHEVNRRIFEPYLSRHDFWWLYNTEKREVNNWTAVCNAGVMGSAIYLEKDTTRLAEILAKGLRSLDDYLTTFDQDGGSSEGPGYWSYGFGNYTIIAHLVEHRTAGKVRMLDGDLLSKVAQFPLRTALSPNTWVNFSDAPRYIQFIRPQLAYLSRRLGIPALMDLASTQEPYEGRADLTWWLRELVWDVPPAGSKAFIAAQHDWFSEMMWMFSRYAPENPNALVLAAKGGHNQEMHNQNDVGSFVVHYRQESLIADIGCGRYTRQYFGPERYQHLVTSSLGHSVPLPNGCLQQEGREFASRLVEHRADANADILQLDLKGAYPAESGLALLERRLTFHRQAPDGWIELEDSYAYQQDGTPFETAITTFAKVEISDNGVLLHGDRGKLRVGFDPESVTVRTELFKDIDFSDGAMDVMRVVFSPQEPQQQGTIRLEIVPVD